MKDRVSKAYGASAPKAKGEAGGEKKAKRPIVPPEESFPPDPVQAKGAKRGQAKSGRGAPQKPKSMALGEALAAAGDEAAALLKTGNDSGMSKAAKFLLLLGTDEASKVISHLKSDEVEAVSREILKVKNIDAAEANSILAEFGWLVKTKGWSVEGGPETAEKMLVTAFGEEKARAPHAQGRPREPEAVQVPRRLRREGSLRHIKGRVAPGPLGHPSLSRAQESFADPREASRRRAHRARQARGPSREGQPRSAALGRGRHQGAHPQSRLGEPRGDRREGGPRGNPEARRSSVRGSGSSASSTTRAPSSPRTCAIGSSPSRTFCGCPTEPFRRRCGTSRTAT